MRDFLRALRESGDVTVLVDPPPELDDEVKAALCEHERFIRAELRPGAPTLIVDAAHWGVKKLYQACQLLTMRDAPPVVARDTLLEPYAGARGPETDYSVDLGLAYAPSLFHLAERVAPEDPVLEMLRRLASDWPLSSVGMPGIDLPTSLPFWSNACLRGLYVDRVIERQDVSRLGDPEVAAGVRAALGAYPELEPRIEERLDAS